MTRNRPHLTRPELFYAGAVVGLILLGMANAYSLYHPGSIGSDSGMVYLPLAREFLERGLALLMDPKSLQVGPMSYIYPALFGVQVEVVRLFNVVLYGLLVVAVCRTGFLLHSAVAGLVAATLFAASPVLATYYPMLYTEALFVTLMMLWTWALAGAVERSRHRALFSADHHAQKRPAVRLFRREHGPGSGVLSWAATR
ncbi:MAG: glycosyltransferase family 39 protein [Leptospirillia bacterium]